MRDWKDDVECCEDPKGLYDLGLEMAEEIEKLNNFQESMRHNFVKIVPNLTSRTWEDIWERVRELAQASGGTSPS